MKGVFQSLDKANHGFLRRSEFVTALRTDDEVLEFIGYQAVKKAESNDTMTLEEVLREVEKDGRYDPLTAKQSKNRIYHKWFLTWKEFMNYFDDYEEIEARNRYFNNEDSGMNNYNPFLLAEISKKYLPNHKLADHMVLAEKNIGTNTEMKKIWRASFTDVVHSDKAGPLTAVLLDLNDQWCETLKTRYNEDARAYHHMYHMRNLLH